MNIKYLNLFTLINCTYDNSNSIVFNFIPIQNTKFWIKRKYLLILITQLPSYQITQSPNFQQQPHPQQAA